MTAALEGGEWSAARPGRILPLGQSQYPFYRRLGGPQGRSGRVENLVPTGIRSRTVQCVVSRYTDWATQPIYIYIYIYIYTHTRCYNIKKFTDVSWVRESVIKISRHVLELNSILVRRWYVVDKMALGQVLLQVLLFSLFTIVLPKRHNFSSITTST